MRLLMRAAVGAALCVMLTAAGPLCLNTGEPMGKRGCCSHHGGVCGCSGSKQRCCDGTNSPSCMCGE